MSAAPLSAERLGELLSPEAFAALEAWPADRRARFAELLEDAASELQRELLQRALGAGRGISELHAFADAIRAMGDEELYEACTLPDDVEEASVVDRLHAEADPLRAFLANGHAISPQGDEPLPEPGAAITPREVPAALLIPPEAPKVLPSGRKMFDGASGVGRAYRPPERELGASPDDPPSSPGVEGKLGEDLINDAVRALGVVFTEQAVDAGPLKLERALEGASAALQRGWPVPVVLGAAVKQYARYALLLQVQPAGGSRAFQLHDPVAKETVWAHEGDLVGRAELPFSNKSLRRITAIALPKP